jgi:hypothetical protein
MLASTQFEAATDTVRQCSAAGAPVRGSTMWCAAPPRRRQRRTVVLDVDKPPEAIRSSCPGASGPARWLSATRTAHPPGGAAPAVAMSPPRLTRTPSASLAASARRAARSAARAFAVAPRSSRTPAGTRTVAAS